MSVIRPLTKIAARILVVNKLSEGGDIYIFVDNSEESKKALEELSRSNIRVKVVDVSKNGLRGWLLFEFGTTETPLLATNNTVIVGYNNIKKFLKSIKRL